jgi:predicted dehydrogenase
MDAKPLRYGIVGLGRAGWNIHANALRGRPDARIVAVADPVAKRREEAAVEFDCATYGTLEELLRHQGEIDVVVIATPSATHARDTICALQGGMHVVVEKPMAMTIAEADEMIRAASRAHRKLLVHQNYRFFPEFLHLRQAIDSGVLGKLFHIRHYYATFFRRNDWQTLAKNGGGLLNNHCSHFIDQILQLAAPAKMAQVVSDLRQIASAGDVEDHVKAFFRFDDGTTCDLEVSTAQNVATPLPKWILCGTHGTLTSDGKTTTIRWFNPKDAPPLNVIEGPAPERKYGSSDKLPWQERTLEVPERRPGDFYDNVYGVIRRGEPMRVSPESVREVIRVIGLVRDAAQIST